MAHVVLFAIPDALASSLALPIEMLRAAAQHRRAHGERDADWHATVAAERRGRVTMSGALGLQADSAAARVRSADLAVVPTLWRAPHLTAARHRGITACVRALATSGTRLCAIGTGSYLLA